MFICVIEVDLISEESQGRRMCDGVIQGIKTIVVNQATFAKKTFTIKRSR
jgi:hypothetical protein